MKLLTEHRIKEPGELTTIEKSAYFKIKVLPAVGKLVAKSSFKDHYYEGERGSMSIKLVNDGSKPINEVYVAVGD